MFNYETTVPEADQALTATGQEPLYIIYPANGLSVADSPLAYVDKDDATKEAAAKAAPKGDVPDLADMSRH